MNSYFVYILANYTNSVLYIGMTNDLKRRIYEHKSKMVAGFTKKYNVNKLVFFEETSDVKSAIQREKNLKKWKRAWKEELIRKSNPELRDLSEDWEKDYRVKPDNDTRVSDNDTRVSDNDTRVSDNDTAVSDNDMGNTN